jgi:periplasmic divalent cation tolerance protein
MSVYIAYITAENEKEAQDLAAGLLQKKLIACANILPSHRAVYQWQGEVKSEPETAMIIKTTRSAIKEIENYLVAHHSYECPCLVAWPVEAGHAPFLSWIEDQLKP